MHVPSVVVPGAGPSSSPVGSNFGTQKRPSPQPTQWLRTAAENHVLLCVPSSPNVHVSPLPAHFVTVNFSCAVLLGHVAPSASVGDNIMATAKMTMMWRGRLLLAIDLQGGGGGHGGFRLSAFSLSLGFRTYR